MKEPTFEEQWPIRVSLSDNKAEWTTAFAWLYGQIFKQQLDHREVFTTFGERHLGFPAEHRRLAAIFKLRFG